MPTRIPLIALLLVCGGCATIPDPPPLGGDPELDAFAREVEADLETHAWQRLLARADPNHYRTQVTELGMPEAQYLAELFGLHTTGNNIRRGEVVEWTDLDRILSVELTALEPDADGHRLNGIATLEDGTMLELRALIGAVRERPVLTGGVG